MGWPICRVLLGAQGFLYAALYSIPIHLLSYSITPALIKPEGDNKKVFDKSMLINVPFCATVKGLIILMSGFRLPESVTGFLFSHKMEPYKWGRIGPCGGKENPSQ